MPVGPWPLILTVVGGLLAAIAIGGVVALLSGRARLGLGLGAALCGLWTATLVVCSFFVGVEQSVTFRAARVAAGDPSLKDPLGGPAHLAEGTVAFAYLDHPGAYELVDQAMFHGQLPEVGQPVQLEMWVTKDFGSVRAQALGRINGVLVNGACRGGWSPQGVGEALTRPDKHE